MNSSFPASLSSKLSAFFFGKSAQKWLITYKLYHIIFWIFYHYLWAVVKTGNPLEVASGIFTSPKFIFYVIFQAIAVYFNLYFLIPRYLEKSRFPAYIFYLIITILYTAILIVPGYYLSALLADSSLEKLYGTSELSYFFMTYTLPSTMASMTLAMSVKLTKNWIQTKRREQSLEKEKLETELKFLRSQFNPHFLFNTINSIFVLIHKNPVMASEALAKFSELLRYQLYECNEQEIPLSQELTYLENFIELERFRHDSSNLTITLQLEPQHQANLSIAPFVLIPFVENAFKHVSQWKEQPNWIQIHLRQEQHQLYFSIANSISQGNIARKLISYRGIGLKNVERRLDLIYPHEHKLDIEQDIVHYKVMLHLKLHEQTTAQQMAMHMEE